MLHKKRDANSGKTLHKSKPLLLDLKAAYSRPPIDFKTTTTIWHVDELIRRRVRDWRRISGETGHTGERTGKFRKDHDSFYTGTYSVFPIPLAEWILVRYGGPAGGKVLDAFAGGPPRAIASTIMGFEYHGVEIRRQQIEENEAVLKELGLKNYHYHLGDARFLEVEGEFDVALTCPPYFNLEVYSDQEDDISTFRTYEEFNAAMWMCADSHYPLMKPGSFVCIVIGPLRDKKNGEIIDFRSHTVQNFREAGFMFHQEIILSKNFGSAAKRSTNAWRTQKLVPRHEYLLVFRKPVDENNRRT